MISTSPPGRPILPVGKILCVGRNYSEHAAEMGVAPPPEPLLFLKPSTALLLGGGSIVLPTWSDDVHHEVELVVRLGGGGKDLTLAEAEALVDAYGVGLDLTARDVQSRAKARGEPWAVAKGFDGSAPVSSLVPVTGTRPLEDLTLDLWVSDVRRQHGRVRDMIWSVSSLLVFASSRFTLEAGDLLFTGTPAGVGPLRPGEAARAQVGEASLDVRCMP
jgi:2-keto-4-pentenoate hydratase/2-oxohepta-3-ene-1,7-dioic acid hydratase in catechol pathway